jgi:hypothetical protein
LADTSELEKASFFRSAILLVAGRSDLGFIKGCQGVQILHQTLIEVRFILLEEG